MTQPSRMRLTILRGAEFWNDSCSLAELKDAVDHGATGATSNPVIVAAVVKADPEDLEPGSRRDHPRRTRPRPRTRSPGC